MVHKSHEISHILKTMFLETQLDNASTEFATQEIKKYRTIIHKSVSLQSNMESTEHSLALWVYSKQQKYSVIISSEREPRRDDGSACHIFLKHVWPTYVVSLIICNIVHTMISSITENNVNHLLATMRFEPLTRALRLNTLTLSPHQLTVREDSSWQQGRVYNVGSPAVKRINLFQ